MMILYRKFSSLIIILYRISKSMDHHCHYVWDTYVNISPAKHFAILAHSAGGRCVASLYRENSKLIAISSYFIAK